MTEQRLSLIKSKLEKYNVEYYDANGTPGVITNSGNVIEVCSILKNDKEICFDMLRD